MSTVIVIGSGHNGLAAAYYLARAGFKPLVLERRDAIGGGAITGEIHPGFRGPTLTHEVLIHERVVRDMDLLRHGVEFLPLTVEACAPRPGGAPLVLYDDAARSVESIRGFSARDAEAYGAWRTAVTRIATVLGRALSAPPPDIDRPTAVDLLNLAGVGRAFRKLGRRDGYRLLRWLPMPVADFVYETFTSEPLCAMLAAPGLSGTMLGPRSAGGTLVLLMREAHRQLAGGRARRVRGGPGALTAAMAAAATKAGADIRTGTPVDRIVVRDDRAVGVISGGRELAAAAVVSSADPRTTFLTLVEPTDLMPDFAARMRNYRAAGTVAKVNLALSALPPFVTGADAARVLSGRIHIGPEVDYLEHAFDDAKYGELSSRPWLDLTIPSILDPELAPRGAHVASIYVHYAPRALRGKEWAALREPLLSTVMRTLEEHAPGVSSLVVGAETITPADLEQEYGLAGGHVFHGELAIDQLFAMRPVIGHARYDSPIRGLYLCGAGTHPGGFLTGASGRLAAREVIRAQRRAGTRQGPG